MANDRIRLVQKTETTSTALSFVVSKVNQLYNVLLHIDALPTTSESLTITVNADAGTDHLIYSVDPSASTGSTWDLFWDPEPSLGLAEGDTVTIAYTNTDTNAISVVANCVTF